MELILYLVYIIIIVTPVWWWRKYKNRKYLLLVIPGVVLLMTSIAVRVSEAFSLKIFNLGFFEIGLSTIVQVSALVYAFYIIYKVS